jgi:hypothetical protein
MTILSGRSRVRIVAVSTALLAVILTSLFASPAASATPSYGVNRVASYFPLRAVNGSPVDGVAGRLHVAK